MKRKIKAKGLAYMPWPWLLTVGLLFLLKPVEAFVQRRSITIHNGALIGAAWPKQTQMMSRKEDEKDLSIPSRRGKEQSNMPGYMASFIDKQSSSNRETSQQPTHMIGIPLEENHGLLLQLESVQRAVIHHCPILMRSAIVPVVTRLPMIYVYATHKKEEPNRLQQPDLVTQELLQIVERVVEKRINVKDDMIPSTKEEEEAQVMRGANADGYRPLVLTFEKLHIEGENNDVLLTAAKEEDQQTQVLQDLHSEIRAEIEALGYKTSLPPDQENTSGDWRPRVPFMRLPTNFEAILPPIEEEEVFRKPEQGGNGISPIFWCKWWDDVFGEHVRLEKVGVYARSSNEDMEEKAFYVAHETVDLPQGNEALMQDEARHRSYQESRLVDSEKEVSGVVHDDDIPNETVREAREQLELAFAKVEPVPPNEEGLVAKLPVDNTSVDSKATDTDTPIVDVVAEKQYPVNASRSTQDDVVLDDWTKERIRRAIEDRDSVKARTKPNAKPKPPPMEENPVFQQYRDERDKKRLEAAKRDKALSNGKSSKKDEETQSFPSRADFLGAWNLVSSPIPSELELTSGEQDKSKSDNIILRVDGTTFGGPVLDRELMHKAAGGTWKNYRDEKDSDQESRARLRIRLVVPPSKQRILVMEGDVTRLMMPSSLPTTRSSFGVPKLEQSNKQLEELSSKYEKLLQCDGEMWIEDARTGANRRDLGSFLLMKMDQSDPSDYVITIPRSIRNQD